MSEISWTKIKKSEESAINGVEWRFTGNMFGYEISMYQSSIGYGEFWEALIRQNWQNKWSSRSCETREEAERKLKIGLLLLPVCRIIGYYKPKGRNAIKIHDQQDGTGLI